MTSIELAWHIRRKAIDLVHTAKASHIASILSLTDIVAVLYSDVMKFNEKLPKWENRDRFVLSKGHAGLAVYIALSKCGFFSEEMLDTYYQDGSFLSGHISHKNVPGVEVSTGALGHGVCLAVGMALAAKKDKRNHRIFVVAGDGECDEGSVWEAALFANQYRLNNLTLIVDHNKMQSLGFCENILEFINIAEKWKAFGWEVREVNGHDHDQLKKELLAQSGEKPLCIIANTVKGKGVSFMENKILWHYRDPQGDDYENAVKELEVLKP